LLTGKPWDGATVGRNLGVDSGPFKREAVMTTLVVQAAWALLAAFLLSLVYEIYRATAKAGTSRYDSVDAFVKNNVALYVVAAVVIGLLFVGFDWAPVIGLVFSVVVIVASILFYNPRILLDRQPGIVDWFEDLVFTGLVFVGAALLLYQVLGVTLEP
jgi:hypothetical protein